jgi:hypothetical protein
VPGCTSSLTHKSRSCLAKHLATKHSVDEATPMLLAAHALARCPAVGCATVCCILPRDTANGWSSFLAHASSCRDCPAHVALRTSVHGVATGTWGAAETALRCAAVAVAPPGSIGAALAIIPSVRHPTATAAAAATMIGAAAAATCATTAITCDDDEPDANYPIPALPVDVDVSCLASIDVDRDVRSISRHLRAQAPPDSRPTSLDTTSSASPPTPCMAP